MVRGFDIRYVLLFYCTIFWDSWFKRKDFQFESELKYSSQLRFCVEANRDLNSLIYNKA